MRTQARRDWEREYRKQPHIKAQRQELQRQYNHRVEIREKNRQRAKERRWRKGHGPITPATRTRRNILQGVYAHHARLCKYMAREMARAIIYDETDLALVTARALKEKHRGVHQS